MRVKYILYIFFLVIYLNNTMDTSECMPSKRFD
jgi:hypothetical protein